MGSIYIQWTVSLPLLLQTSNIKLGTQSHCIYLTTRRATMTCATYRTNKLTHSAGGDCSVPCCYYQQQRPLPLNNTKDNGVGDKARYCCNLKICHLHHHPLKISTTISNNKTPALKWNRHKNDCCPCAGRRLLDQNYCLEFSQNQKTALQCRSRFCICLPVVTDSGRKLQRIKGSGKSFDRGCI